jgi:hypothetical protein
MKLRRMHHRIKVQLAVTLAPDPDARGSAQKTIATCTNLSRNGALLAAERAPQIASNLWLTVSLPGDQRATVRGTVVWAQTTTAPSLLCGDIDRALGSIFEVEFASGGAELAYLTDLVESRLFERRARARRIVRRVGIGAWQHA